MAAPRFALYFAPEADEELARRGAAWLGRDARTGTALEPPRLEGLARDRWEAITASPRRYGFHATLKAPFELAAPNRPEDLAPALDAFAAHWRAFEAPPLILAEPAGFLALLLEAPSPAMAALERALLSAFEPFRAALSEADIARRRKERLTQRQSEQLVRFGYPYVHEDFTFHMTLTERLGAEERARLLGPLAAYFAPALGRPLGVTSLCLFAQERREAPFRLVHRARLAPLEASLTRAPS